jgi:hypothetical protein
VSRLHEWLILAGVIAVVAGYVSLGALAEKHEHKKRVKQREAEARILDEHNARVRQRADEARRREG